jgi:ATP/maltotriose-dependent transcriptional regulator MalT
MAVIIEHDTVTARRLSAEAADVARSLGVLDLEMLAQAVNGFAHVCEGDVAEGMRLLDEATTAAVAGEMTDLDSITVSCCCLIYACERVRDIGRAAQWCDKLRQITARWSYQAMFAYCRTHYAGVLIARGEWQEAESELTTAMAELDATYQAFAFEAIVRLAELRRLQGRLEEADELLSRLDHHPLRMLGASPALLGRAGLALEAGDPTSAVDLAERHLRSIGTEAWIDQVDGLEVLVLAHVVLGELDRAAERLHDLVAITTVVPTPLLRASARYAGGALARAVGDLDEARRRFEDAVDLAEQGGSRYHAARARLELAEVLVTLKRTDAAGREARAALQVMAEIGAARATARAEDLFDRLERSIARGADGANNGNVLTPREIDVLRLISQGKNNREAAEVLGLSEHTVHRHVSNILTKLNLPSRAAAVAHAGQHGLL